MDEEHLHPRQPVEQPGVGRKLGGVDNGVLGPRTRGERVIEVGDDRVVGVRRHLRTTSEPPDLHPGHQPDPQAGVDPCRYPGRVEARAEGSDIGHDALPEGAVGKGQAAPAQVVGCDPATPGVATLPDREAAGQLTHDVADERATASSRPRDEGDHRGAGAGPRYLGPLGRHGGVGDGSALRRGVRAAPSGGSAGLIIDITEAGEMDLTAELGGEALSGTFPHPRGAPGVLGELAQHPGQGRRVAGGTRRPSMPSRTSSGMPPRVVATTGVPAAKDSRMVMGWFSCQREGTTMARELLMRAVTAALSSRPWNLTRPGTKAPARRSSSTRDGPSPAMCSSTPSGVAARASTRVSTPFSGESRPAKTKLAAPGRPAGRGPTYSSSSGTETTFARVTMRSGLMPDRTITLRRK